ncbi:MAG: PAS domain S-box protein, partial [Methylococcaceae bacterium]|nr:PAS domain S-box protein [Methylococcaceae bacterium]
MIRAIFSNIQNPWIYTAQVLLLAACYFISGEASFSLTVSHSIVTLVVFAAEGFALAAVILFGSKIALGIFLGQLLLALNNGLAWELALGISVINSLEAILGGILFRYFRLNARLESMFDISTLLVLIFLVLQPFSASFGILLLWSANVIETANLKVAWFSWWFGNSLGQVLITPMLLTFFNQDRPLKQSCYKVLFISLLITPVSLLILSQSQSSMMLAFAVTTPLLILIAINLDMNAATLATVIFSMVALFYTHNGQGVFVRHGLTLIQDLNIFLLGIALCAQFVAAILSERKQMEQALRNSEKKFRAIINSSPVPMALNDAQQKITLLNPAFIKTFAYTLEDIPTLSEWWPKAYPDENYRTWVADTWNQHFESAKQQNVDFDPIELNICCNNGDFKTVLASATVIENNFQGEHLVLLYDITERKYNEERIKLCQSYGGIGIWEANLQTNQQIWSEEVFNLLGFPRTSQPTWDEFLAAIHPEDKQRVVDKTTAHLVNDEEYKVEYRIITKDKSIRWMRSAGGVEKNSEGEAIYFRGIVHDISERKQAENALAESKRYFEALVSISPVGVFQFDATGKCLYVNSRWSEITGLSLKQALGNGWSKGLHPKDKKRVFAEWQNATLEKHPFLLEYRFLHPDGAEFWVLGQSVAMSDANGTITGYMGTITDITKHKKIEKELQRSNADLEQFAYAVSHDMRQPLRMVSSYLKLLENALAEELNADTQKLFDFAMDGSKRMDEMILALLDFSRVGRKTEEMKLIDTRSSLDEALAFLAP